MRVCQFRHFGPRQNARDMPVKHLLREVVVYHRRCPHANSGPSANTLRNTLVVFRAEANLRHARDTMTESTATKSELLIPEQTALEMRRIAHELSNSLEVIVQTSYLLGMAELKEPASDWLKMLDSGVNKALEQNLALRDFIKKNTQPA
jgi:hypothetical protein